MAAVLACCLLLAGASPAAGMRLVMEDLPDIGEDDAGEMDAPQTISRHRHRVRRGEAPCAKTRAPS